MFYYVFSFLLNQFFDKKIFQKNKKIKNISPGEFFFFDFSHKLNCFPIISFLFYQMNP